MDNIA
jgi:hypothetical protein